MNSNSAPQHIGAFIAASVLKSLLFAGYRSTDFEVHRNWLAVTHSKPASEWYWDSTSIATLDYPPFFAWFEWALGKAASLVGFAEPLVLSAVPLETWGIIIFQRLSVLLSDGVLLLGVTQFLNACDPLKRDSQSNASATALLGRLRAIIPWAVLLHPSLLLVDHIHFQYNGLLIGLFLLVLSLFRRERFIAGSAAFVALCCTKHLFIYLAPVLGLYTLRQYITADRDGKSIPLRSTLQRFAAIALSCAAVAAAAVLPVTIGGDHSFKEHMAQLASRLFPFGRGLTHAYWAPNIWALYLTADKAAAAACKLALRRIGSSGYPGGGSGAAPLLAMLSGLCSGAVEPGSEVNQLAAAPTATNSATDIHGQLSVLPSPTPALCATLVLLAMLPALRAVWRRAVIPNSPTGVQKPPALPAVVPLCAVYAWLCGFAFGWHVHEKASLYALIPLLAMCGDAGMLAALGRITGLSVAGTGVALFQACLLASVPAHVSLLPLIFTPLEQPFVLLSLPVYLLAFWPLTVDWSRQRDSSSAAVEIAEGELKGRGWNRWIIRGCLATRACVAVFQIPGVASNLIPSLPFLPLMLTSVACAAWMAALWLLLACLLLRL